MWAANAATVTPSRDATDNRVHFTPANLVQNIHRAQETTVTAHYLRLLFPDDAYFCHHQPLLATTTLGDEGAANHSRLCETYDNPGLHLYVYGRQALPTVNSLPKPKHYPARQTLEASQANARNHLINKNQVVFAQQNPTAIDAGVFHNDVIAVANESTLLLHEDAFLNQAKLLNELRKKAAFPITMIEISSKQLKLEEAVQTYLFNSQLITLPHKAMALIAPIECQAHSKTRRLIETLLENEANPITEVHYLDLRQSMQNGGGPACLRLRVPLTETELQAMHQGALVTDKLLDTLTEVIKQHYRTALSLSDLADPQLIEENYAIQEKILTLLALASPQPW